MGAGAEVGIRFTDRRLATSATTLVEHHDAISVGIEESPLACRKPPSGLSLKLITGGIRPEQHDMSIVPPR